jgi:plasmid stability protein
MYCDNMKNLTVSLDDEVYRRARMRAAERDTSVSAMVRQFLVQLASEESETERLKREEARLRDSIQSFRATDRIGRDELHRRDQ